MSNGKRYRGENDIDEIDEIEEDIEEDFDEEDEGEELPSRGPGAGRGERRAGGRPGGVRRFRRRRGCPFLVKGKCVIDYKDVETLRQYLTETGKIRPRRQTGACSKCQRALAVAIKRARHLALLPYAPEHTRRVQQ
jgi:small subunit ribosomal protein S18